ncbi:MAG: MTH1187 family thiamine-binding protein [Pseudomonadales bacterium]|nr:MTH1187 family thiamine-binding protein [Pseudomonadales bacterium]
MHVHVDFCLIPLGGELSVAAEVAECQRVLRAAGLEPQLHAYGTNVEGDWDQVMAAIKECHRRVHAMGRMRISSTLRIGTRSDRHQTLADKVERVERLLAGS